MDKNIHVLVFPAGEVNSVELHDALSSCVNITLYGGSSVDRHGPYIFKNYIRDIPLISDETFFESFNEILKKYSIDVIFPTHDTVAAFFADNQSKIDAKVIVGTKETSAICRDKQKTYELFADCDFIPKTYNNSSNISLPVFAKPKVGAGSVGAVKITTTEELKAIDFKTTILSEYLPGEEYTVDCFTDKNGNLMVISPRSRDRTLAGISVSGEIKPLTDEIQRIAIEINKRLIFTGLWFFQIKKNEKGEFKLLEISTRCAGTMCLTRARGINLALLSVYVALGYEVDVIPNDYNVKMDRTLITRYNIDYEYDTVYLDFDDTVIMNGEVNIYAMMFIYQCKNKNKNVYLITKHEKKVEQTLIEHSIDKSLFKEIIHLDAQGHKVEYMNPKNAVFIDNAYQERKLVHDTFKIPVFDVDAIEVLLDWRT